MIEKNDCDHLNKQCGVPRCHRRAVYWYVNAPNRGRNIYACHMHDKEARAFVETAWPESHDKKTPPTTP